MTKFLEIQIFLVPRMVWYGGIGVENFTFLRETDDTDTETETDDTVKNAICKCFGKTGFSNLHYK